MTRPPDGAPPAPPHPVLRGFYRAAEERPAFVRGLFDRGARHYDRVNAVMSLGSGGRYRGEMLARAGLAAGARALDVAAGTGLTAREARRIVGAGGRVVGLDNSPGMLAEARRTGSADHLVLGSAEALPFADASFDLLSLGYALRHVGDLELAFREFRRVLRPGGTVLVLELGEPAREPGRSLARLFLGRAVPALAWLATGGSPAARSMMAYYWATIEACAPPGAILAAMGAGGLEGCRAEGERGFLRAYLGRRPAAA